MYTLYLPPRAPAVEERTHKLANAKVFSKLYASDGYCSLTLDEQSRLLFGGDNDERDTSLHNLMLLKPCARGLLFNRAKCHIKAPEISFFGNNYSKDGASHTQIGGKKLYN